VVVPCQFRTCIVQYRVAADVYTTIMHAYDFISSTSRNSTCARPRTMHHRMIKKTTGFEVWNGKERRPIERLRTHASCVDLVLPIDFIFLLFVCCIEIIYLRYVNLFQKNKDMSLFRASTVSVLLNYSTARLFFLWSLIFRTPSD
jgi:hypothetical protein